MHGLKFGRRTVDIAVQDEFSLNIRSKKRLIEYEIPHTKIYQLCFISRDQILASLKKPLPELHRGEVSDPVVHYCNVNLRTNLHFLFLFAQLTQRSFFES